MAAKLDAVRRRVTKKEVIIAMQLVGQAAQGGLRAAQHEMNASRHNDEEDIDEIVPPVKQFFDLEDK